MSLPVAILAGGLATRLRPFTERQPKILLEVAGRPFAEHQIRLLRSAGITRVVYCVGYLGEEVARTLGDGSRWQMTFTYVDDGDRLQGTGGALWRAVPQFDGPFFVMYGDSYLTCDYNAVEHAFRGAGQPGLMTVFRNDDRWDKSNVRYEGGRILRYEKGTADPAMHHIDYGLGVLTPDAFADLPQASAGEPFDLEIAYQRLIARGALAGYEVHERFYEIGSREGLEELTSMLEARALQR